MNKPKFSFEKALQTVKISSKIEGHKIPKPKLINSNKKKSKQK
jgi:hypothetical protein